MKNYERVTPRDRVEMLNFNQHEDMTRFYMYALRCFDLENQIENGELLMREETINTTVVTYLQTKIQDLEKENAELKARLEKAVELKAKVGDTVYMPWVYDGVSDIAKSHICSIIMDSETVTYAVDFIVDLGDAEKGFVEKYKHGRFAKKDFGKIVFTDYTEAEQRLAELRKEAEK